MNTITVAVDIDDTVCRLTPVLDEQVRIKYPDVKIIANEYLFSKRYMRGGTCLHSVAIRHLLQNTDWLNLEPVAEAITAIKRLQKAGVKIIFLTHRSKVYTPNVTEITQLWLKKYFKKFSIVYARDKITRAEELGCAYLIDNSREVLAQRTSETVKMIQYTGVLKTRTSPSKFPSFVSWENLADRIMIDCELK